MSSTEYGNEVTRPSPPIEGQQPIQYVILDTCILEYLSDKKINRELFRYLSDLQTKGFGFALSTISFAENLTGLDKTQEAKAIKVLESFPVFHISKVILLVAARLHNLYKSANIEPNQSSLADKIIASSAILGGSLVLTADVHDFPRPYFKEADQKILEYKVKNKQNFKVVQLLRPEYEIINLKFGTRV